MLDSLELILTEGQLKGLFPDSYLCSDTFPAGVFHPGDQIGIVTRNSDGIFCESAQWGFIPSHRSQDSFEPPLSHAYAEDVTRRWSFSGAFRSWRCLILASSYVVAPDVHGGTTYYRIRYADGSPLVIAGIYNPNAHGWVVRGPSVAMLTAPGHLLIPTVRQQMPHVLLHHEWEPWLRSAKPVPAPVKAMLKPREVVGLGFTTFEGHALPESVRRGGSRVYG